MAAHPSVISDMLIRRPAIDVYEYFVVPEKLCQFWLSHASTRLEVGKKVLWKFKIAGAEDWVEAKALEPGKRIVIIWDRAVEVEWTFQARSPTETMVKVEVRNIPGTQEEQFAYALDVAQGFMIVLLELKSLLEKGSILNAVHDKYPDLDHA